MPRKILHSLTMTIILFGLLIGYVKSDYNYDPISLWNSYYYAWAKGIDILLMLCILFPCREFKKAWWCMVCFFVVREVWQVYAIDDYATASRPSIIFLLFLTDIFVICTIMILPRLKKVKWPKAKLDG